MASDITSQIDQTLIADGTQIDANDVKTPLNNFITVINNILNGVEGFTKIASVAPVTSTLASDAFTVSSSFHIVAAQTGTTDDLSTITTGGARQFLIIQADTGDTITVKHNVGNIKLNGGADFALSGDKTLLLFYDGNSWNDVGAGGAGGSGVNFGTSSLLTIATDTVTRTGSNHTIDTEGAAATDNLSTINANGATAGFALVIKAENTARDVVVKHNVGNIRLNGGLDFTLDNTDKMVLLIYDGTNWLGIGVPISGGGGGTVTSVALTAPAEFSVTGSPVTTSGTLALAKANQNANLAYAGPASGAAAAPTFRALDNADLPNPLALAASNILTLASDAVTVTKSYHIIAAQTGTADDLATLNSGTARQFLIIQADTGDTITVKHGTGNIFLNGGVDVALSGDKTLLLFFDGTNWSDTAPAASGSGGTPANYRRDLRVFRVDNGNVGIEIGEVEVNGTLVTKTALTKLAMATGGDWIGGASNEAASQYVHVYVDASGNVKLHNKAPNYPRANTAARVFTALVNQIGWNGTNGSGLDATSVIYDGDTGEGSVVAGMLLGVYGSADADYGTGRGKGSAASASVGHSSWARITAIDTGTNTLTLEGDHEIAFNDNDRLIAVQSGDLLYRDESGTWYRWIGALYNNASSNLANTHDFASYEANEGADYSLSSGTYGDIDSTNMRHTLFSEREAVFAFDFNGNGTQASGSTRYAHFTVELDGALMAADDGIGYLAPTATSQNMGITFNRKRRLLPGTHVAAVQWKRGVNAVTYTLRAGAGAADNDVHPQFSAQRLSA